MVIMLNILGIIFLTAGFSGFAAGVKLLFGSSYYDLSGFEKEHIREMKIAAIISLGSLFSIVIGAMELLVYFFDFLKFNL